MSVKLLTEHHLKFLSLKCGCTCSSESTLVKMPHCWKSHVKAHLSKTFFLSIFEWPLKTGSTVYNTSREVQKREAYCGYSRTMEKLLTENNIFETHIKSKIKACLS